MHILFAVGVVGLVAGVARALSVIQGRRLRRWVTDTVPCTGGCGREIRRSEKHVTINRHVEYMDSPGIVTVIDADTVAVYHLWCEPK